MLNPYQILFPFGLVFGIGGALLWIAFALGQSSEYPGALHADIMMGGFLTCFAGGFLMTALPRFTGTEGAGPKVLLFAGLMPLALILAGILGELTLFHLICGVSYLLLVLFALIRFKQRKFSPPPSFIFVGIGLASGFFGLVLTGLGEREFISTELYMLGKSLYFHSTLLSFVLGIGSRLIPAFLGRQSFPNVQIETSEKTLEQSSWFKTDILFPLLGLIFVSSFFIEIFSNVVIGRLARSTVISFITLKYWQIYLLPKNKTRLSWGLWIAAWFIVLGSWGYSVPAHSVDFAHLMFISGFGLLTCMIATRVSLSHGNHPLILESRGLVLPIVIGLIVVAAVTRAAAFLLPESYVAHLGYAALVWILALSLWGVVMLPYIFKRNSQS